MLDAIACCWKIYLSRGFALASGRSQAQQAQTASSFLIGKIVYRIVSFKA